MLRLLRQVAAPKLAKKRGSALKLRRRKEMYELDTAVGVGDLLKRIAHQDYRVSVLFVPADPEVDVTGVLAELVQGEEVERGLIKRPALYADHAHWIVRLCGARWTAIVRDTGHLGIGPWLDDFYQVAELGPRLSRALGGAEVVHLWGRSLRAWQGQECTWNRDYSEAGIQDGELADEDDDAEYNGLARRRLAMLDEELTRRGIFIPPVFADTDGYFERLTLWGLRRPDVALLERVVLERERALSDSST